MVTSHRLKPSHFFLSSVLYLISAFASPLSGFLIDLIGYNTLWVSGAILGTICSHLLMAFTFINPFVAMSLMGVCYSLLAASLWPMVALIVPKHQLGTAYGLMQSIQNLGLACISLLTGIIVDKAGYFVLEVFFLASLCCKCMTHQNLALKSFDYNLFSFFFFSKWLCCSAFSCTLLTI